MLTECRISDVDVGFQNNGVGCILYHDVFVDFGDLLKYPEVSFSLSSFGTAMELT